MKTSEYAILTMFLVMVLIGGLVALMIPRESNKIKIATDSAKMRTETMEPVYGSINGGDQVVIKGENIATDSAVMFGENLVTKVNVSPDHKQIVVTSPPNASAEAVPVIVFNGTYQAQLPMMFFYTK